MKASVYEKIKGQKPFELRDIIIYALSIALIIILLLVFVILPKNENSTGFKVQVGDKTVLTLNYSVGIPEVEPEFYEKVVFNEQAQSITVYLNGDKTDYNTITFNKADKWVKMTESTCSVSKDCLFIPKISNGGVIYCAPHDLKIIALASGKVPIVG